MSDYPTITFRTLIRRIFNLGFQKVRQKGSHIRFSHPDGRKTTVPDHGGKDVPQGLLAKSIRYDLDMSIKEFFEDKSS